MKKLFILSLALFLALAGMAQDARKEIAANPFLSASNYLAYPGPAQQRLTPAPKGYTPFHISHYGRHGSRYHIGTSVYNNPYNVLMKADSLGKLTALGRETLKKVAMLRAEAYHRDGELTPLGALQHKDIARRMYERFPDVFSGEACIDAKSTVVIRCILSMENELQQLLLLNPRLQISHDASYHEMFYMNYDDPVLNKEKYSGEGWKAYEAFRKRHINHDRLMASLFNDTAYWHHEVDKDRLGGHLFSLASNAQSSELGKTLSLYDLFTADELYALWRCDNAGWYISFGPSPLTGGRQPYTQANLLRNIIQQADSCLRLPHPGATLRFGHEVCVLPLACLLELDNCGQSINDLEQLDREGWVNYRIFPMASNIQFIFYRSAKDPSDILVKVLLNENEATLPLPYDRKPYYRWSDFRAYFMQKLDAFEY